MQTAKHVAVAPAVLIIACLVHGCVNSIPESPINRIPRRSPLRFSVTAPDRPAGPCVAAADRPVRRSWFKADTLTAPFSPTLCNFSLNSTETGKPPEDQHDDEEPRFAEEEPGLLVTMPKRRDKFWYLDVGFRVSHTRLESTNDQINKRVELPQKLDIFGLFNNPYTPLDRKTDGGLATAYIGIGRRETDWLTWNFYLGGGIGGDHNHQRWLNANYNVNFDYAGYYTGVTADIYPWGLPEYRDFSDWKQRLRASRPYLLTGFELGYIRAKGWGNYKLAPLTLYADEVKIRDWLASYLLGIGWELPLNQRWSFMWSGHYSFHFYRPEEYNSWVMGFALRYRF